MKGACKLKGWHLAFCILLWGAVGASSQEANLSTLDNVRVGRWEDRTRLVFDLSAPVTYSIRQLDSGHGVSLDLSDTREGLARPLDAVAIAPISGLKITPGEDGVLHAVVRFDTAADVKIFALRPHGDRGERLVLDIMLDHAVSAQSPVVNVQHTSTERVPPGAPAQAQHRPEPRSRAAAPAISEKSRYRLRLSGTWEQEGAIETEDGSVQKFESLLEPRIDIDLPGRTDITAIARARLDAVGDLGPYQHSPRNYSDINGPLYSRRYGELTLRELYLDTRWGKTHWRWGKQQVVWGEADGIKVLDVLNPQSFREYILDDFDDSRIPLYMVKMEAPLAGDFTLQVLWIPDTTYHELADPDATFYITSPILVPVAPPGLDVFVERPDTPDDVFADSDAGGRISGFLGGWDITLNYLYQYQDLPVLYQQLELTADGARGVVSPEYERSHMAGGTLSNVFGDVTVRAELVYNTDTYHVADDPASRGIGNSSELGSVLGLDWQLGGYDTLLSAQWFQSHLFDYSNSIQRDETEHVFSLYFQKTFAQETWVFDALALYSHNNSDSLAQLKLKYLWQSNIEVWGGADIFLGDRDGLFGQFRDQSRVLLGFELGF